MPARIAALCTDAGQSAPSDEGELVRSILVSLACKYRLVCEQLEQVCERTHRHSSTWSVAGLVTRLLCQLTADVCEREVVTGPVEATALGNVLVQAMASRRAVEVLADLRRDGRALGRRRAATSRGRRRGDTRLTTRFVDNDRAAGQ